MQIAYLYFQTAFTSQKDFGKEAREAAWAAEQRTLHGLQSTETKMFVEKHTFRDINIMAEEAKRRAEVARSASPFRNKMQTINSLQCNAIFLGFWFFS